MFTWYLVEVYLYYVYVNYCANRILYITEYKFDPHTYTRFKLITEKESIF